MPNTLRLTDLPMVCFGPMVMSKRPALPSRNEMLCLTYTGIATMLRTKKGINTVTKCIYTSIILNHVDIGSGGWLVFNFTTQYPVV